MSKLTELINYGQSYWLDNLSRQIIEDGTLQEMVSQKGLRGITSNPSIFQKAISGSNTYDRQIKELTEQGKNIQEIYEALTVKDVQDACDILKPVFDESKGRDGFVSLEVAPFLARDTQGSMNEARRLFKLVNRKNCMIKIPGTKEGIPAIEEMLYEGININITLLFSIEGYKAVAVAYQNAIHRRMEEGKPIDQLASVASLFISRIDVLVDQLLSHYIIPGQKCDDRCPDTLLGKAGIITAQLCYQEFKTIFSSDHWENCLKKGAHPQKPLWASTSSKNPLYPDVRYVNALIAENTVNTLPDETILAFESHGTLEKNAIEENIDEIKHFYKKLKFFDIDINFVTKQLENEGIQKFIEAYSKLMNGLAQKRNDLLKDTISTQKINAQKLEKEFKETCAALDEMQAGMRLFKQDPYLWKSDYENVQAISERMGWLSLPKESLKKSEEFISFVEEVKSEGFKYTVLLGMGGSSLCSEVAKDTFKTKSGFLELIVLDNTSPEAIQAVENQIDLANTLFIVASKSGGTTETISFFQYFYDKVKTIKNDTAGKNFCAITDDGTNLVALAKEHNFRKIFLNPTQLGGRYSVLSDFGIVPMALMGVDIQGLLLSAQQIQSSCDPSIPAENNPGLALGILLGVCQKHKKDKITFVQSDSISSFGYWVEQLLAESTGKEGKGLIPINGETLGAPEDYGNDRLFVHLFLADDNNQEAEEKLKALESSGHPVVRIQLQNKIALGAEFYRWEIAVAISAIIMKINPFDQPNVEESKQNTKEILSERDENGALKKGKPLMEKEGISIYTDAISDNKGEDSAKDYITSFLNQAQENDYIAILPYMLMTDSRKALLQSWRMKLRNEHKVATTLLAGPRYLHSTGQLHKGGPNTGIFIILTHEEENTLAIPNNNYDFGILDLAEALGDFKALNDKKRKVIRIHLGTKPDAGLQTII